MTPTIFPNTTTLRTVKIQHRGWAWCRKIEVPGGGFLLVYRISWRRTFYVRGYDSEGNPYILGFPTKDMAIFAAGILLGGKCDLGTVFPACEALI